MSIRYQRLILILVSLTLVLCSVLLILYNVKDNISYFYTPSELKNSDIKINKQIRIGGFIKKDSFIKLSSSSFKFSITDNENSIEVSYNGILPDLFREEQGAVIEGYFQNKNIFNAVTVFAKHDENYMPSSIKKKLENTGYWEKKYK